MSLFELKIYPNPQALFSAAARVVTLALQAGLGKNPNATFVLAGGATPRGVYELLAASREFRDWNRVTFFWGDERCVPPDSDESNSRMVQESLLSSLSVPDANIHRIHAELEDGEKAALLYQDEVRSHFQGSGLPRFDLVLLGMGEDGHTASLFPGTHWDEERLVIVNHAPRPPIRRISMTPRLFNLSQQLVFLVAGQAKAYALKRVLEDPSCDYPAKRIQPTAGELIWMVDSAAASQLR